MSGEEAKCNLSYTKLFIYKINKGWLLNIVLFICDVVPKMISSLKKIRSLHANTSEDIGCIPNNIKLKYLLDGDI